MLNAKFYLEKASDAIRISWGGKACVGFLELGTMHGNARRSIYA